ncbi:hypothetical protein BDBG_06831 [Blastomyces gilchristii SLH14081]|uniref:Uncharacterized protein n=1 Tax=Blastomyces gilchristii (strain SLH14081) TaxID=559298 RepID=A0A179UW50_BLAGS|nr:uncharacterized protein BDBG_06831 [Blastomyces gilchristii SLH14081]OAT11317.1 hypothetical protein BDBG_06831 [Blastomyces gilchristii SLH14081]
MLSSSFADKATVPGIKLSSESSLNDHTESYITVLVGRGGSVATAVGGAGDGLDADKPAGRRDDTPLQGAATTTAAARDAGEGEDVAMEVVLLQLIDTIISVFNLAFLTVMEAAAAP